MIMSKNNLMRKKSLSVHKESDAKGLNKKHNWEIENQSNRKSKKRNSRLIVKHVVAKLKRRKLQLRQRTRPREKLQLKQKLLQTNQPPRGAITQPIFVEPGKKQRIAPLMMSLGFWWNAYHCQPLQMAGWLSRRKSARPTARKLKQTMRTRMSRVMQLRLKKFWIDSAEVCSL